MFTFRQNHGMMTVTLDLSVTSKASPWREQRLKHGWEQKHEPEVMARLVPRKAKPHSLNLQTAARAQQPRAPLRNPPGQGYSPSSEEANESSARRSEWQQINTGSEILTHSHIKQKHRLWGYGYGTKYY